MERGKEDMCTCLHTYLCCMQKSVSQLCLPAGMLKDSQTHIHMHVLSIQQFTTVHICM